jgi:hypothetical protein
MAWAAENKTFLHQALQSVSDETLRKERDAKLVPTL